jgi:hypothetical protein
MRRRTLSFAAGAINARPQLRQISNSGRAAPAQFRQPFTSIMAFIFAELYLDDWKIYRARQIRGISQSD